MKFRFPILMLTLAACNCASSKPVEEQPSDMAKLGALLESLNVGPVSPTCPDVIQLPWEIGASSALFQVAMTTCEGVSPVIEIDSRGGNVNVALDIAKKIERHPHPVYCLVDGRASSCAFDILQSCDLRFMTPRSTLMQHNTAIPQLGGMAFELQNAVNDLRVKDEARAQFCSKRMNMPIAKYKAKISDGKEWHMTLAEALDAGAVDFEAPDLSYVVALARAANDGGTP